MNGSWGLPKWRSQCGLGVSPSREASAVLGSPQVKKPLRSWGLPK